MKRALWILGLVVLFFSLRTEAASFWEKLGLTKTNSNSAQSILSGTTSIPLSQDEIVNGLKQALTNGIQLAVSNLGKPDGFMTNLDVKIPMPSQLATVEKGLRSLHQDKLADDFVLTMNRAAEQAVPVAAPIVVDALKSMTMEDAKNILLSTNDAATQYFRKVTETNLFAKFLPIIQKATESNNVTVAYKNLLTKAQQSKLGETSSGTLGSILSKGTDYLSKNSVDLDTYVTQKAMDGLFKMISVQEAKIREQPAARTTALLQKVFGAVTNTTKP